jgi:hypothetical protein
MAGLRIGYSDPMKSLTLPALALAFASFAASSLVQAEEAEFCPERPGQTTPTCVMPASSTMLESGVLSWTRQTDAGVHSDQWALGDHLLRHGLGGNTELQFGWRMLARSTGISTRTGDVSVGLLHNFSALDGPVALQAFATLPTGGEGVGAGDWGAGLRLPVALPLGEKWSLGLTPEVDAAVNASGRGRHAALGGAIGVGRSIAKGLNAAIDLSLFSNQDPSGHTTSAITSVTFAWQVGDGTQLDLGLAAGLNHDSLDHQAYIGFAHRF